MTRWTNKDEELLRTLYPNRALTISDIAEKLNRTIDAVYYHAKILKLRRESGNWTNKEIELLRKLYPNVQKEQICDMLDRNWNSIREKAWKLGIKRKYRENKTENFFEIDNVDDHVF